MIPMIFAIGFDGITILVLKMASKREIDITSMIPAFKLVLEEDSGSSLLERHTDHLKTALDHLEVPTSFIGNMNIYFLAQANAGAQSARVSFSFSGS
jgi:hypothetical protein